MNEQEKPTGIAIYDHILTQEERAEVTKVMRDYDGSVPFKRYLEEYLSFHVDFIEFDKDFKYREVLAHYQQ